MLLLYCKELGVNVVISLPLMLSLGFLGGLDGAFYLCIPLLLLILPVFSIAVAALLVNQYVAEGVSTSNVPGYNQPFGTLVTFYSSCAGSTRAMGLVLEYMGFQWYHVNENQWDHQWCVVYDVDGQTAFADGSVYGIAGYGQRQPDGSNWMQYRNGALQPF